MSPNRGRRTNDAKRKQEGECRQKSTMAKVAQIGRRANVAIVAEASVAIVVEANVATDKKTI